MAYIVAYLCLCVFNQFSAAMIRLVVKHTLKIPPMVEVFMGRILNSTMRVISTRPEPQPQGLVNDTNGEKKEKKAVCAY